MSQSLVGFYSIATTDNEIYVLDFSIPNNCEYIVSGSAGAYTITVQLKKGQIKPSTTFVDFKETLASSGGIITVDFNQECDYTLTAKPKIRVEYT